MDWREEEMFPKTSGRGGLAISGGVGRVLRRRKESLSEGKGVRYKRENTRRGGRRKKNLKTPPKEQRQRGRNKRQLIQANTPDLIGKRKEEKETTSEKKRKSSA